MNTPSAQKVRYRTPHLFIDAETTRLRRPYLPYGRRMWEIGAELVLPGGSEEYLHLFVNIRDLGMHGLLDSKVLFEMNADGSGIVGGVDGNWYDHLPQDVQDSLAVGRFHERHPQRSGRGTSPVVSEAEAAAIFAEGRWLEPWEHQKPVIVGTVVDFDAGSLHDLLYRHNRIGPDEDAWNFHTQCAVTYAAGYLGWTLPWKSDDVSLAVGVDPADYDRHTALGDARWARAVYEAVVIKRGIAP